MQALQGTTSLMYVPKPFVLADFMHILAFSFGPELSHNLRKNENHAYFKLNLLID